MMQPDQIKKNFNFRDPDVPLVVDENIELPQLALIKNYTADCTQVSKNWMWSGVGWKENEW